MTNATTPISPLTRSEVEGVRIVVISLRNIAKNDFKVNHTSRSINVLQWRLNSCTLTTFRVVNFYILRTTLKMVFTNFQNVENWLAFRKIREDRRWVCAGGISSDVSDVVPKIRLKWIYISYGEPVALYQNICIIRNTYKFNRTSRIRYSCFGLRKP